MDKYQTIGARFLALIIDSLLTVILVIFLFVVYGSISSLHEFSQIVNYFGSILIILLPIIYTIAMHAQYGQTLGKMAAKVKVLNIEENPINLGQAIIRSLPQIIPLFLVIGFQNPQSLGGSASEADKLVMPYLAGITNGLLVIWNIADIIVALSNEKHRALHDYIAGTVVVKL